MVKVKGDGNCQWRSIAVPVYGNEDLYQKVKCGALQQMKVNPDLYLPYFGGDPDEFAAYVAE